MEDEGWGGMGKRARQGGWKGGRRMKGGER
jgi:hypothetical protein